jgi:hypothetical protein
MKIADKMIADGASQSKIIDALKDTIKWHKKSKDPFDVQ